MRLWSIQTEAAYTELEESGRLRIQKLWANSDFIAPYDWMIQQMTDRIGPPPGPDVTPVWGWRQYESTGRPRPDLRRAGHLPPGIVGYRIEFNVDPSDCLFSDFELWHYVLNYWYLPESERDRERFEKMCDYYRHSFIEPAAEPFDRAIRSSWARIFDLNWYHPSITHPRAKRQIQATLWEIDAGQVIRTDRFTGR